VSDIVIFGTGSFGEVARFLFEHDSPYRVVAFTAHQTYVNEPTFAGVPLVPFETIQTSHPPATHKMFVAVGYTRVNAVRAGVYADAKAKGYELVTYVSSKCTRWPDLRIGDNCFIFEDNTLQPFVSIGNDVVLWSGNHIGHHSSIGDHAFLASHIVVSGHVKVGERCFIGVNATLRDSITIGDRCVIGAGAIVMKSTRPDQVYIADRTKPDRRRSDEIGF
jgi:sugar O-acyltransferase (sialic acid O-acetyltransferase NeuD family)